MTDKFKKIIIITKAAVTTKIPTNIYNDCLITYKQTIISKNKPKQLAAIQDKFNSQKKQKT